MSSAEPYADIITYAQEVLSRDNLSGEEWREEFVFLLEQYQRLHKHSAKLVKVGDSVQNKLIEANLNIYSKVEELKAAEEQLQVLTVTDTLTNLPNRRGTYQYLEGLRDFALFLIDIDHFKRINDSYGHNVGDEVLSQIAGLMRSCVRGQDFLGRWGGEEFLLVLPYTDLKGGKILAEKIRGIIDDYEIKTAAGSLHCTISLGGALHDPDKGLVPCLEEADKALYKSKNTGRNKVSL